MTKSTHEERVQETERLLRSECQTRGIKVAGDGSVLEPDAEELLGYGPRTLQRQRLDGTSQITRRRVGNRWRYRLRDLAEVLEGDFQPGETG